VGKFISLIVQPGSRTNNPENYLTQVYSMRTISSRNTWIY